MDQNVLIVAHEPSVSAGTILEYLDKKKILHQYIIASNTNDFPNQSKFQHFIILGGTLNVCDEDKYQWLKAEKQFIKTSIQNRKRGLGICLGGQLLAEALGAEVRKNKYEEVGWFPLHILNNGEVNMPLKKIDIKDKVMQSHGYTFDLPANSIKLASSEATKNQAFLYDDRILGVQFHPEVSIESVRKFYDSHKDESSGPFVQQSSEILKQAKYFERSRKIMFSLLDWLFEK